MTTQQSLSIKEEFDQNGYVILRNFFTHDEIDRLREDIINAGKKLERQSTLNKDNMIFYSNVFKMSAELQAFVAQKKVIDVLKELVGPDFWVRWDQCVAKAPGGAEFPWHQDNGYNKLRDRHFQFWVGITEMTKENGGLWLQPGSHKYGILPHDWMGNHLVCKVDFGNEVFVHADKGDVVIFSSLMLHHTKTNNSASPRWAYVIEYISCDHYDPLVKGPFFLVSQGGVPVGRFVPTYKGHRVFKNRLKYLDLQASLFKDGLRKRLKKLIKK